MSGIRISARLGDFYEVIKLESWAMIFQFEVEAVATLVVTSLGKWHMKYK
jgi:hypothetical protein